MLKLKKATGPEAVALTLTTRDHLFNRDFCIALAVAAGLHLMGLLLFSIQMSMYLGSNQILSPVTVLSEPLEFAKDALITVDAFSDPVSRKNIGEPPRISKDISALSQDVYLPSRASFHRINQLPDWPAMENLVKPMTITATGMLAGRPFREIPKLPKISTHGDFEVIFQVRVDDAAGEIFWFKLQKSSGKSAIDQLAEKMLKNTHFENSGKQGISSGTMEWKFHLNPVKQENYD